jgi:predicted RNase H-like nuclease (RuvC/YqgF family)
MNYINIINMETLLYLSSVSLLIIIGVYIIWSLRSQSEDMYYDISVSKIEAEIKRLESEKAHIEAEKSYIKEAVKIEKSYSEGMRSCLEHIQELHRKIESLNSQLSECKRTAKEENLRHKREVQSLYGQIGVMQKQINRLKK